MIQIAKNEVFGLFLEFGPLERLDMAIVVIVNIFQHLQMSPGHGGSFKYHENAFLNDLKWQKGRFLDLSLLDRLDIAYFDRTICFLTFGMTTRS